MIVVPDGQPARRRNFHHVTTRGAALYLGESGAKAQSQTAGSQAFRLSVSAGFKVRAASPAEPGGQDLLGCANAASHARRFSPDRDREHAGKKHVPLDPHAEGEPDRLQFTEAPAAEFRIADVGETEHDVAVLIQLGREPDARAKGIVEFHDGNVINIALPAIGEELRALCAGQEDHAAALRLKGLSCGSARSSSGRCPSSQSAALLAWEAARMMARLSSRSTSSQEAI